MPIYMDYQTLTTIVPSNGRPDQNILQFGDGSVRPGNNVNDIAASIRMLHPKGVNLIIIGVADAAGWSHSNKLGSGDGSVAILIGLLLPAVQKCREAATRASIIGVLRYTLAPGGGMYYVGSKGELLPAV